MAVDRSVITPIKSIYDYLKLVPPMNANQPNFTAVLEALIQPLVDSQTFLSSLNDKFDIDSAIGVQLDVLGVILGRSRYLTTPIPNIYFSWGTPGLGWGQGYWKGPFDPVEGLLRLDDDTYRLILRAKIIENSWDGTIGSMLAGLHELISILGATIFVQDNMDMSITVGISQYPPSALVSALLKVNQGNYLNLKPEGVRIAGIKTISVPNTPIFGFGMNNQFVAGWGKGSWATDV